MNFVSAISVYPDVQDGAPVFSGTRIRIETFFDYLRIGVSVNEFLREFPSVTHDQAVEVRELAGSHSYSVDQIAALVTSPESRIQSGASRLSVAA